MKSIVQNSREGCYICGRFPVETHHIFFGTANRSMSDKYGLTVDLCAFHHRDSISGAHFNAELDALLKRSARKAFKERFSELNFEEIFINGNE